MASLPFAPPVWNPDEQRRPAFVPQAVTPLPPPTIPMAPLMGAQQPLQLPGAVLPNVVRSQKLDDVAELNRLKTTGSGISQIQNPWLRGVARVADTVGRIVAPRVESMIGGSEGKHQVDVRRQQDVVANDQSQDQANAVLANTQAQEEQRKQLAALEIAKAQKALVPAPEKIESLAQLHAQAVQKALTEGRDPHTDPAVNQIADQITGLQRPAAAEKDASLPQQYLDAIHSGDLKKATEIQKVIHDTQVAPKIEVHAADARPESTGTWQMVLDKDNKPMFFNSKTGEVKDNTLGLKGGKGGKPTVDEQKRADFAKNMGENINTIEDVLSRRPELFGPVAGRITSLKSSLGSSDPDIAKLEAAEHQLAMVTQGVHGMRSSQGLEGAAKSLINGFKNSPEATKAALETARNSTKTFLSDADHPGETRSHGATQSFKVGGRTYNIPADQVAEFKKDHPDAR